MGERYSFSPNRLNSVTSVTHLCQINLCWEKDRWMTLISSQKQLLGRILLDVKDGEFDTFAQILPMAKRLVMDMSDYLAHGLIQSAPSC